MILRFTYCLALALTVLSPAIANVDTIAFTTIAFPNIPDPSVPNAAQSGLFIIVGGPAVPTGINNNGVIVGSFPQTIGIDSVDVPGLPYLAFQDSNGSFSAFYAFSPFVIGEDGAGNPVSEMVSSIGLFPRAINDSGTVAGNFPGDAFLDTFGFTVSGIYSSTPYGPMSFAVNPINYPNLTFGFDNTFVNGINNSGTVIGRFWDQATGATGGYSFNNGVFTLLSYTPLAINNLGQIVGLDAGGDVVIDTNGVIKSLGVLPFLPSGFNDSGTIVGGDYLYQNGSLTQIQLQGSSGVQINAINDEGVFVGTANGTNGQFGFEAATPEPGALLALLAGIATLALVRYRRNAA